MSGQARLSVWQSPLVRAIFVSVRIPARLFSGDFGLSMERSGSGHPVRGVGWGRVPLEHPFGLCLAKGANASLAGLAIVPGQAGQWTSSRPGTVAWPTWPARLPVPRGSLGHLWSVAQRSENALRRLLTVTR